KPEDLAKGISHALVVTLLGIGLSVPAIFCHAFFRNRLIRISLDTSNIADDLLTQMFHNSRKPVANEVPRAQPAATPPVSPPSKGGERRGSPPSEGGDTGGVPVKAAP